MKLNKCFILFLDFTVEVLRDFENGYQQNISKKNSLTHALRKMIINKTYVQFCDFHISKLKNLNYPNHMKSF